MTDRPEPLAPDVLVGVDVGGTFTDAVVVADGRLFTTKVPTTPDDQSKGVVSAVVAALTLAGVRPTDVARFAHGMTVGTNALLEGTGAPIALVTTEGFADVIAIRRQDRAHLYRLDVHHPPPIVPRERRFEVRERCGPDGVIEPLDPGSVTAVVDAVVQAASKRSPSDFCSRMHIPTTNGRSPPRCARRCRVSMSAHRARCFPRSGNTSASRRHVSTRIWHRCCADTWAPSVIASRTPGCRHPRSCSPTAG